MTRLVVDCSVALAWSVSSQATALTQRAETEVQADGGMVPFIFPIELCNALYTLERRRRLTARDVDLALHGMALIAMEVDALAPDDIPVSVLPLSRAHRLSLYDAAYLELALRMNLPLATRDRKLSAAARAAGATLFVP